MTVATGDKKLVMLFNTILTCCLIEIFPPRVFLVQFDRNDSGKTKAALATITKAKIVELEAIDFMGLHMTEKCFKRLGKYY